MKKIKINGKEYPYCLHMGAMRRYTNITGESIQDMGEDEVKAITLAYCTLVNGCKVAGMEIPFTEEEFADLISPEQFAEMTTSLGDVAQSATKDGVASGKKK